MRHALNVAMQLIIFWAFIVLYIVTIIPLAIIAGVFTRREK